MTEELLESVFPVFLEVKHPEKSLFEQTSSSGLPVLQETHQKTWAPAENWIVTFRDKTTNKEIISHHDIGHPPLLSESLS